MTLKEGKTKEGLYDVLTTLASKMDVDAPYAPVSRGEVREEPGKGYALVVGWNNSKVSSWGLGLLFFIFYLCLILTCVSSGAL